MDTYEISRSQICSDCRSLIPFQFSKTVTLTKEFLSPKKIQYKQIAYIYMKMQLRSQQSQRNKKKKIIKKIDNYCNNEKEVSVNKNHTAQVHPFVQEREWTQSGLNFYIYI